MSIVKWLQLIGWVLFCLFVGGLLGSFFTTPQIPVWYSSLNKPSFQPPNWIFGPVWTILYILMGVSAFLVWRSSAKNKLKETAIIIFLVQMGLNALWSPIFFNLHLLLLAFLVVIILWIAILITMIKFYEISKPASILLIPYILWVSFASILNFSIWQLNR